MKFLQATLHIRPRSSCPFFLILSLCVFLSVLQHDCLYFDSVRCAIIILYITLNSFVMVPTSMVASLYFHPPTTVLFISICTSHSCLHTCFVPHSTSYICTPKCLGIGESVNLLRILLSPLLLKGLCCCLFVNFLTDPIFFSKWNQ